VRLSRHMVGDAVCACCTTRREMLHALVAPHGGRCCVHLLHHTEGDAVCTCCTTRREMLCALVAPHRGRCCVHLLHNSTQFRSLSSISLPRACAPKHGLGLPLGRAANPMDACLTSAWAGLPAFPTYLLLLLELIAPGHPALALLGPLSI